MSGYIIRRVLYTVTLLIAISIFGFVIIELPPGDFVSTKVAQLEATGQSASTRRWWMRCACSTGSTSRYTCAT